jgi:hypothetical protein
LNGRSGTGFRAICRPRRSEASRERYWDPTSDLCSVNARQPISADFANALHHTSSQPESHTALGVASSCVCHLVLGFSHRVTCGLCQIRVRTGGVFWLSGSVLRPHRAKYWVRSNRTYHRICAPTDGRCCRWYGCEMAADNDRLGSGIETGNVPGNPLRSYRMSMLSHAFVQEETDGEFVPDENQPMSYAVIGLTRTPILRTLIVGLALIGFVVLAWLIG